MLQLPDLYREIARLALYNSGVSPKKKDLAAKFREMGILPETKDPDDTRGVQEWVDAAFRYFVKRDQKLSGIEASHVIVANSGDLFDKYPLLGSAVITLVRQNPQIPSLNRIANNKFPAVITQQVAADCLNMLASFGSRPDGFEPHFAISGGIPVYQSLRYLAPSTTPSAYFYGAALLPAFMSDAVHISPEVNTVLAWASGGFQSGRMQSMTLPLPPWAPSPEDDDTPELHAQAMKVLSLHAEQCANDPRVAYYLKHYLNNYNILLTSIEPATPETLLSEPMSPASYDYYLPWNLPHAGAAMYFTPWGFQPELLAKAGAVGAINYSFFDAEGKDRPEWRFCVTPSFPNTLHSYRQTIADGDHVVAIVTSPSSVPALKVALKTGLCNFLITDELIALKLMED